MAKLKIKFELTEFYCFQSCNNNDSVSYYDVFIIKNIAL